MDVALSGAGFFVVKGPSGPYTAMVTSAFLHPANLRPRTAILWLRVAGEQFTLLPTLRLQSLRMAQ